MAISRPLDPVEKAMLPLENEAQFTIKYRGNLEPTSLSRAFENLCRRYPILRTRVSYDGSDYLLYVQDKNLQMKVIEGGLEDLLGLSGDSLFKTSEEVSIDRDLVRLSLVRGDQEGYVMLGVDHAIVDGASLFAIFSDLFNLYTADVSGNGLLVDRGQSLPEPPSILLKERWGEIERHKISRKLSELTYRAGVCRQVALTESETRLLVEYAKNNGVTVGSYLLGEAVLAFQRNLLRPGQNEVRVQSIVNVRGHVDPPIGATETTYFCGLSTTALRLHNSEIEAGREWKEKLNDSIINRRIHFHGVSTDGLADTLVMDSDIGFNNPGILPEFRVPDDLEVDITELHFEYMKTIPVRVHPEFSVAVYTWNKRLKMMLVTHSDKEHVLDDFILSVNSVLGKTR